MIRTALQPKWLLALAVVIAIMVGFTFLGLWQLDVARNQAAKDVIATASSRPAVPLTSVIKPHAGFPATASNQKVTVTGRYDATGQLLVTPRLLDGQRGFWVLTPLDLADGSRIAVVRGFVTDPTQATAVPATQVTVTGTLAPGESPAQSSGHAAGQIGSIDLAVLVNAWPHELYNAFVFMASEQPTLTATSAPAVRVIPPPQPPSGMTLRNAAYALQWWVFALFALYLYWRTLRDDHLAAIKAADTTAVESDPTPTPEPQQGAARS